MTTGCLVADSCFLPLRLHAYDSSSQICSLVNLFSNCMSWSDRQQEVNPGASWFASELINTLSIRGLKMEEDMDRISQQLRQNSVLSLNFEHSAVRRSIRKKKTGQRVFENYGGRVGFAVLCQGLLQNSSLTHLDLSWSNLDSSAAKQLAAYLVSLKCSREIRLKCSREIRITFSKEEEEEEVE
eukprot:g838.t1